MAIRKKPQTEAKAKGLVGYKGGKQINKGTASANKSVGDYKGRTLNLSQSQLGAAGRKAAGARTVDIGKTTFDKSKGGVLGPGGKPLTGRVDLGGGNIAVYKQGVRVRATAAKPKGGNGGGGGGAGGSGGGAGSGAANGKTGSYQAGRGMSSSGAAGRSAIQAKAFALSNRPKQPKSAINSVPARNTGGAGRPVQDKRNSWSSGVIRATGMAPSTPTKPKTVIGRDTGNHKTTFYANGTARVWDAKMKKFVTVGKSDSRYPKR